MNAAVDAAVCLLLVGAAVFGVSTVSDPVETGDSARTDAVAESLATSTTTVTYALRPGTGPVRGTPAAFPRENGSDFRRTTHGTFAGLLARAAVDTAGFDDDSLTGSRDDFRRAVREATAGSFETSNLRIDAEWRPYPGSPVGGRVGVGTEPPETARVHAATLSVPSGADPVPVAADDFETLGLAVSERVVETLVPRETAIIALRGDYPSSALMWHRYGRLGEELGVSVERDLRAENATASNRRLADALAPRVESDLRDRFDSPSEAASAVDVHRVRIVVRAWESEGRVA
ncbi:hypothetical protein SAMN04488063_0819 [Halopelagius inordinatus]|uniref:Uncharacterized protein n=1 Tax=Halopelagius inordinatus TaxID=553467 RepID=A0A1I2MM30_9EURY|nr:hypothetical protein [Halopelagius inordinatus]SFF92564.1 hypothetical protein SAMN04488063_0819 [Halopelagius inordinatus]